MKLKTIITSFFAFVFLACLSAPASAGFSLGYAQDVIHSAETSAGVLRYDHEPTRIGGQAMYWDGPHRENRNNTAFSVDYDLIPSETIDLTLGGVYISEIHDINGTHLNYSIGVGVNLMRYIKAQYKHFSNGRTKNNEGWNFVGVLFKF